MNLIVAKPRWNLSFVETLLATFAAVSWVLIGGGAAAASALNAKEMQAVCLAQSYLRANGFPRRSCVGGSKPAHIGSMGQRFIQEERSDGLDRLLASRHAQFAGKLFAYVPKQDGDLIVYRMLPNDVCLKVGATANSIHKLEGNCRPDMALARRVAETDLACGS